MYLARLTIENFRTFGSRANNKHLVLNLSSGLNLVIGENDSGKTCVVDALRALLGTTPPDSVGLQPEDFHSSNGTRASTLRIEGEIVGLSEDEAAALLEYLEIDESSGKPAYRLRLVLTAERDEAVTRGSRRWPVRTEVRAGPGDSPQRLEGAARELLRATYLKPLRDAVSELAAKKGSRLSQILYSYPQLRGQEVNDHNPADPSRPPTTITGISRKAESEMRACRAIQQAEAKLNSDFLAAFSIGPRPLTGRIGVAAQELRQLLERMELTLSDQEPGATRGLGHHNVLFMATELLALDRDDDPCLPLVLIEEPEAHLHPQLQLRLVEFFRKETEPRPDRRHLQVLLTSHSPNIASRVGLRDIIHMHAGRAFSLRPQETLLDDSDYEFLERFLDVTKADLLFARGLLVVEGDAEAILLPTIAELIGSPLSASGTSVINVGSVGLFRYSRIFQRADSTISPTRVACVADRDIPPDHASGILPPRHRTQSAYSVSDVNELLRNITSGDSGSVKTFVSEQWTLEHDLALAGLSEELHIAIVLATKAKSTRQAVRGKQQRDLMKSAIKEHDEWVNSGKSAAEIAVLVYAPLLAKRASKPETAQLLGRILRSRARKPNYSLRSKLPSYLLAAIEYATSTGSPPAAVPNGGGVNGTS